MTQAAQLDDGGGPTAKYSAGGFAFVNGVRRYGPSLEELLHRQQRDEYSPLLVAHPSTESSYRI